MDVNYLQKIANSIRAEVPRADLPQESSRDLFRIYAVLLLAKGLDVDAEDVHNAWVSWICTVDPMHEAIVPFENLPPEVAAYDKPYVEAIHVVARRGAKND
tara:strand:- start:990 stop:1292 length:303 start_codon:yes stop_codon:yes gene_type:complete